MSVCAEKFPEVKLHSPVHYPHLYTEWGLLGEQHTSCDKEPGPIDRSSSGDQLNCQHLLKDASYVYWASLVAQRQRIRLPVKEIRVGSLGQEDSLEKGMATHPGVLAWRIPWTEKPGGL